MSKELEALEDIILYLNASEPKGLYCENIETIQQALLELQSIKEANPSEALNVLLDRANHDEYLGRIGKEKALKFLNENKTFVATIKQALLKTQEPKQYLKWEDLEFSKELKFLNVRMNNNDYILQYTLDVFGVKCCFLCDSEITHCISLTRQFFNDLHLEVIE